SADALDGSQDGIVAVDGAGGVGGMPISPDASEARPPTLEDDAVLTQRQSGDDPDGEANGSAPNVPVTVLPVDEDTSTGMHTSTGVHVHTSTGVHTSSAVPPPDDEDIRTSGIIRTCERIWTDIRTRYPG